MKLIPSELGLVRHLAHNGHFRHMILSTYSPAHSLTHSHAPWLTRSLTTQTVATRCAMVLYNDFLYTSKYTFQIVMTKEAC